jgi:hypothetical protein
MAKKIWTGKVLTKVFTWLPNITVNEKTVGYYNQNWTQKPPHLTNKEYIKVIDILYDKLITKNIFDTAPNSVGGLQMQLNHCFWASSNLNFRKNRARLRMYAVITGFMEHRDVIYLENLAQEKSNKPLP